MVDWTEPAAIVETHISVVVFVGDRAFKLKKPVDLGFLDFSTREARWAACTREVALNRRLAPDVYLGVAEAFVSSDERLLEAAREVSKTSRYPRCVISTRDFLDGITASTLSHRCPVCGSTALIGLHAFDPGIAAMSS